MANETYQRSLVKRLIERMNETRHFIQMLVGPRQTGKSTAIRQALETIQIPVHEVSASIDASSRDWLRTQWNQARNLVSEATPSALLVIDEVQIIDQWSAVVKELWDEDSKTGIDLRVAALRTQRRRDAGGLWGRLAKSARQYGRLIGAEPDNAPADPYDMGKLLAVAYPERIGKAWQDGPVSYTHLTLPTN